MAAAVVAGAGRARAAAEGGATVTLRVVASPAEARETREVVADLLSRIAVAVASGPDANPPPLVEVEIDLSTGGGAPFVALAMRQPRAIICRRSLSPQASREVLIESAAEVAYAAVESHARVVGLQHADLAPPPAGPPAEPPPATPPPPPEAAAGAATALQATAKDAEAPGYGFDAAAVAAMQVRGDGPSMAGGGVALTYGLRRIRLAPSLALSITYLRPVGAGGGDDLGGLDNRSLVSTRLGATVTPLAFGQVWLQVGPSLALDVVRGDGRPFVPGPGPGMMMFGPTESFSGLAIWAGPAAQLSFRLGRSAHVFLAAGVDYQLRPSGAQRYGGQNGPNGNYSGPFPPGVVPSPWRSCFLAGLSFTLAGRPPTID